MPSRPASRPVVRTVGQIADPLDGHSAEFDAKLRRMVARIKAEADGKTCSECVHYRETWCAEVVTAEGEALEIQYSWAVACREWGAVISGEV